MVPRYDIARGLRGNADGSACGRLLDPSVGKDLWLHPFLCRQRPPQGAPCVCMCVTARAHTRTQHFLVDFTDGQYSVFGGAQTRFVCAAVLIVLSLTPTPWIDCRSHADLATLIKFHGLCCINLSSTRASHLTPHLTSHHHREHRSV